MLISDFIILFKQTIDLPCALLFIGAAVLLTLRTNFLQIRGLWKIGAIVKESAEQKSDDSKTKLSSLHALFTAMGTSIGMGNMVGPALGIVAGGPGALFWLVAYSFFSSVTKYVEVTLALAHRERTQHGYILGGPMQYLRLVSPWIARWYAFFSVFLFAVWSANQANTLAKVFAQEGIYELTTGIVLAFILLIVLWGGVQRVGALASKLVPAMFIFYVSFALYILFHDLAALRSAIHLIITHAFTPAAAIGGFVGATMFDAMKSGIYRSIYITEAGIGTSAIPHSLANTEKPQKQGLLALYSMAADTFLCVISGLMVLVTGTWKTGTFSPVIIYDIFRDYSPFFGKYILLITISLFVITTVIGNSFNGSQIFAWFTRHRWLKVYYLFVSGLVVLGSVAHVPVIWSAADICLTFVAIPNLICVVYLAFKHYKEIKI